MKLNKKPNKQTKQNNNCFNHMHNSPCLFRLCASTKISSCSGGQIYHRTKLNVKLIAVDKGKLKLISANMFNVMRTY